MPRDRPTALVRRFQDLHVACSPNCIVRRCNRGDCTVQFTSRYVRCVDCDRCAAFTNEPNARKPDFILLSVGEGRSHSTWLVVEMKTRAGHVGSIAEQLQAGADAIENNTRFAFEESPRRIVPLLLHQRGIHTADIQVLNSKRIRFAGRPWAIQTRRCGVDLSELIDYD